MKKGLIFVLGMIAGCIMTVIILWLIGSSSMESEKNNFQLSEHPIPFTVSEKFEVLQVLNDGALATCEESTYNHHSFTGPVVYLLQENSEQFYTDQIIKVPQNKTAIQIGTYRYNSKMGERVVPVIKFENRKP